MKKLITKVRCKKALEKSCDGHRISCPHYELHTETKQCMTPSVCSRLNILSDRKVQCEVVEKVFVKGKSKKRKRKKQEDDRPKRKVVRTRKKRKADRSDGKDVRRKNKRIKLVRKKS